LYKAPKGTKRPHDQLVPYISKYKGVTMVTDPHGTADKHSRKSKRIVAGGANIIAHSTPTAE
jgi:hypothetical protein